MKLSTKIQRIAKEFSMYKHISELDYNEYSFQYHRMVDGIRYCSALGYMYSYATMGEPIPVNLTIEEIMYRLNPETAHLLMRRQQRQCPVCSINVQNVHTLVNHLEREHHLNIKQLIMELRKAGL